MTTFIAKGTHKDMTGTGKIGDLSNNWDEQDISSRLGFTPQYGMDASIDGKTECKWIAKEFDTDGNPTGRIVSVYDYKGHRWSVGGTSPDLARKLFGRSYTKSPHKKYGKVYTPWW